MRTESSAAKGRTIQRTRSAARSVIANRLWTFLIIGALVAVFFSSADRVLASDAANDFSTNSNPNGVWSYGYLPPGPSPNSSNFTLYATHSFMDLAGNGTFVSQSARLAQPRHRKPQRYY